MKKVIFGIFAHPDDEAFGPSGALLKETRSGSDLHLITLTDGGAGTNPDKLANLGEVRLQEWQKAGTLFGAKSMHHLGYNDGELNNSAMIEVSEKLITLISTTLQNEPTETEVEFITLDLNGYTGHIDHIVAARAACFVFYRLKQTDNRFSKIKFACLPQTLYPTLNTSWIFMEAGRNDREINEVIDARNLREDIIAIIETHNTQRGDGETLLRTVGDDLGRNYFIVRS